MRCTPEQRAAIADREGSSLLAAGAGSGKTAVMVERFAEAVLRDGVAVGAILTLTFTEKAAAELRERIRRRFDELGEPEHARAVDAAWIGTIHGFCARVLRSRPLAAGLDPRFGVLDEAAARRLAAEAFEAALETWTAARGVAGGRPRGGLRPRARADGHSARTPRCAAAGRRIRGCRVPPPAPPPDPAPLAAAAAAAAAALRRPGARVTQARAALEAAERLATGAAGRRPEPGGGRDRRRASRRCPARSTRRSSARREGARGARLRRLPRGVGRLPRGLRRPPRPARARAARRAARRVRHAPTPRPRRRAPRSTSTTSSCASATCSPTPPQRERWAERFALIMVDEFQDTNRLQLDVLEALERDNLFAVGDEAQSIYGFRHADVRHLPGAARRAGRDARAQPHRQLQVEQGDPGGRQRGDRAAARRAASRRSSPGRAPEELRLFEPDPPGPPARRAARGRDRRAGTSARTSSGSRRSRRSPGAARRRARSRTGCAPRSTPAARSATSSCSSARRARCGSTSRRSRRRA